MLRSYFKALGNILFPRLCCYCQAKISRGYLCLKCHSNIVFLNQPRCRYCSGKIKSEGNSCCKKCRDQIFPYNKLISVTSYKEPMIRLIHLFKYQYCDYIEEFLSRLMIQHLSKMASSLKNHDLIVPIPLHPQKLKTRGYNQAKLLAEPLAKTFSRQDKMK